jgi:hypothetical protein
MLANVFDVGARPADVYGVCRRHPKRRVETARMSLPMSWDDVQVERFTGTDRPDLVLLRGHAPVLAVEVTASNPLSDRKREAYAAAGVPWMEVDAHAFEEILRERFECDLEQVEVADIEAVPVRQWTFHPSAWRCPYCRAWSRFREGASVDEHEQDALLASDEDRFRPWWRRELDLTSGSGHDVTLDLCIGIVLDVDLQPATVGLYLGEKLFPLLVTPYAAFLDERDLLRGGMAAVLRRLLTVLRDHGAVVCGKTAWRVEDAAACGAVEQVTG